MPRYLVERDVPESLSIPNGANGRQAFCGDGAWQGEGA